MKNWTQEKPTPPRNTSEYYWYVHQKGEPPIPVLVVYIANDTECCYKTPLSKLSYDEHTGWWGSKIERPDYHELLLQS